MLFRSTDFYTWHTADELKAPGAELRLAEESKRDVGAEWRDLGRGALKVGATLAGAYLAGPAAGLLEAGTAGAGAVAGGDIGAFLAADAAASAGSVGINWGAAAAAAAKSAAINAAVTAAQGGNIGDVLKAGALGAVSGGAGVAGAELLGGGALAQIGTQTAISTAIAAATGRDPVQAAISGALTATIASIIPSGTANILTNAGITDPSIQKAINSAISSSVITAIRGGDIGTAALMGAVNSGLSSVAGMIGDTQVVKDLKASISDTISSTVDAIKYETGATNALALPVEGSNRANVGTALDVINRNMPPPLVQAAIDQNTPRTADNVVIPPLIQQATGQSDANDINQFFANYTPNAGAPLGTYAGATTSDVNPVTLQDNNVQQNEFLSPEEMRDFNGDPIPSGSGITLQEWLRDKLSGGGFKSSPLAQEAPPKYGSDVPQVDAQGNPVRTYEPRESYSPLSKFGQGSASALDNTVGGILPMAAQLVSYLGLRTYDEILQAVSSMVGSDYKANPEEVRLISHKLAGLLSQPFGKAGDVIASQFTGRPDDVTGSGTYEREITGQALRGVDSALNTGADYI